MASADYQIPNGAVIEPPDTTGAQNIPAGVYYASSTATGISFVTPFSLLASQIIIDSGVKRLPVTGDYYYIAGDKANTIYRAIAGTVFDLPATDYGILQVV